jgi:putative membrane protein
VIPSIAGRAGLATVLGVGAVILREHHGVSVPPLAHTLLGVALGLLLVFRTNSAYDRFWEGRKLLGMLVNRSRDLARQITSHLIGTDEASRRDRERLRRHLVLFYALVRQDLRRERDLSALTSRLVPEERAMLEASPAPVCVCFTWISMTLSAAARAGRLTEQRLQQLDANLTSLADSWGGAERIMKTPVPFAYAHHIKAFLTLFVFTAPFAMVDAMQIYTPLAAAALAFALFGIDEIGIEIEDPFGHDPNDLPLDAVGDTIEQDVEAIARLDPPTATAALA